MAILTGMVGKIYLLLLAACGAMLNILASYGLSMDWNRKLNREFPVLFIR